MADVDAGGAFSPAGDDSSDVAHTKNQTIVDTIKAPRLREVTYLAFIKFKKERENYEREIDEKNKEPGVHITKASYITCVDHNVLDLFIERRYILKDSVQNLTEEDVMECIDRRSKRSNGEFELADVEKAIRNVRIKMNIPGAEPRIDTLILDYKRALEAAGYPDFCKECPKLAIGQIFDRLKPPILQEKMEDEFEKQDAKGLRKKCFRTFISVLVKIADTVEKSTPRKTPHRPTDKGNPRGGGGKDRNRERNDNRGGRNEGGTGKGEKPKPSKKHDREPPLCLNPECKEEGLHHFLKHCERLKGNDVLKRQLLEEWRKQNGMAQKKKAKKGMRNMGTDNADNHSTLFRAKFSESIEANVLADNCADDNLMPPDIFERLLASKPGLEVTTLSDPLEYHLAVDAKTKDGTVKVICEKIAKADVELKIRHGTVLMLRNVEWAVSTHAAQHVLIGRPLLEALGLDTRGVLEAACEKHDGIINVPDILPQKSHKEGTLAKFIRDAGVFHSQNGDDGFEDDEDIYIDLGEDKPGEVQAELTKRKSEAAQNGISEKGQAVLAGLLIEYEDIFRVRLGKTQPAKIDPMKVKLKHKARPVIAKARRYKADQREFMNKYIDELERMGFVRKNPYAQWAAAPLIVPKESKAKFRMTVDLRPVNAATEPIAWPMPHVESEIYDFSESKVFATIDFVSGYWQLPLHPDSQASQSIITPKGIYSPTRTLQGAVNSPANFQSKVEPLFHKMRDNLKAWIDDFILHTTDEETLLTLVRQFFRDLQKVWPVPFGQEMRILY